MSADCIRWRCDGSLFHARGLVVAKERSPNDDSVWWSSTQQISDSQTSSGTCSSSRLDEVDHALHLCQGAFRTSPATSLCVAANEPPLELRQTKLSLQYILKLGSNQQNPTHTQFRQSKEKPSLYVGFQVMSAFLEMRRLILLQKMAFLSLLLH